MIVKKRPEYTLLLSHYPCEIFEYYNVTEMHGLNAFDCRNHLNNTEQAYIAGWSNFVPKKSGNYKSGDDWFIFINLTRCTDIVVAALTAMHELMHFSMQFYEYDENKEEKMVSWANKEAFFVIDMIKTYTVMEPKYL